MPNRVLKDSINESRGLTSCTFFAQDLYKRLITYADDYGRFNADPQIMVARLYPRELSVVSLDDLTDALIELVGVGKIAFYTSTARKEVYGAFPNWNEHQRIRDSKKRNPDPSDTTVNDWYYRRFIPLELKAQIIERDNFKCKICGKQIAEGVDAKRLVKMAYGTFHIDHIVPCQQGGRATLENLRLTCAKCNLSRKKSFTYDEILQFAENGGEPLQNAATCELLRPESNPIQSESESNPNDCAAAFERFWAAYPRHTNKRQAVKAFEKLKPDEAMLGVMLAAIEKQKNSQQWTKDGGQFIPHPATWLNGCRWEDEMSSGNDGKQVTAQQYGQRDYTEEELLAVSDDLIAEARRNREENG